MARDKLSNDTFAKESGQQTKQNKRNQSNEQALKSQPGGLIVSITKQAIQKGIHVITGQGDPVNPEGTSELATLEKALGTSMKALKSSASAVRGVRSSHTANADKIAEFILISCVSRWLQFEIKIPDFSTRNSLIQQTLLEARAISTRLTAKYAEALQVAGPEPEWRAFKEALTTAEYAFKTYVAHFGTTETDPKPQGTTNATPSSQIVGVEPNSIVKANGGIAEPAATVPLSEAEQTILHIVELLGAFTDSPVQPETVIDQLTSTLNNVDFLKGEKRRRELALAELEGHIVVLEDQTRPPTKRESPSPFDTNVEPEKRKAIQREIEISLVTLGVIRDRVSELYTSLETGQQKLREKNAECDAKETALGEVKVKLELALKNEEKAQTELAAKQKALDLLNAISQSEELYLWSHFCPTESPTNADVLGAFSGIAAKLEESKLPADVKLTLLSDVKIIESELKSWLQKSSESECTTNDFATLVDSTVGRPFAFFDRNLTEADAKRLHNWRALLQTSARQALHAAVTQVGAVVLSPNPGDEYKAEWHEQRLGRQEDLLPGAKPGRVARCVRVGVRYPSKQHTSLRALVVRYTSDEKRLAGRVEPAVGANEQVPTSVDQLKDEPTKVPVDPLTEQDTTSSVVQATSSESPGQLAADSAGESTDSDTLIRENPPVPTEAPAHDGQSAITRPEAVGVVTTQNQKQPSLFESTTSAEPDGDQGSKEATEPSQDPTNDNAADSKPVPPTQEPPKEPQPEPIIVRVARKM